MESVYFHAGLIFSGIYGALILRLIYQHNHRLHAQYSNHTDRRLHWIGWTVGALLFLIFCFLALDFGVTTGDATTDYLAVSMLNVGIIYFVAINGLRQLRTPTTAAAEVVETEEIPETPPADTAPSINAATALYARAEAHMREHRAYLDHDLTMSGFAAQLATSERSLSRAIRAAGTTFHAFVNAHRVAHAKALLVDPAQQHLTVEAVAFESGFASRATFYRAFKAAEGQTPAAYQRSR